MIQIDIIAMQYCINMYKFELANDIFAVVVLVVIIMK